VFVEELSPSSATQNFSAPCRRRAELDFPIAIGSATSRAQSMKSCATGAVDAGRGIAHKAEIALIQ
jgi:hypothetical protein